MQKQFSRKIWKYFTRICMDTVNLQNHRNPNNQTLSDTFLKRIWQTVTLVFRFFSYWYATIVTDKKKNSNWVPTLTSDMVATIVDTYRETYFVFTTQKSFVTTRRGDNNFIVSLVLYIHAIYFNIMYDV